jgi:hypothetical protein
MEVLIQRQNEFIHRKYFWGNDTAAGTGSEFFTQEMRGAFSRENNCSV